MLEETVKILQPALDELDKRIMEAVQMEADEKRGRVESLVTLQKATARVINLKTARASLQAYLDQIVIIDQKE